MTRGQSSEMIPYSARPVFIFVILFVFTKVLLAEHDNPVTTLVKSALRDTARSCMVSVNATEADLEHLKDDPPFPEKAACIVKCLLEKIGVVKNNRYSKGGFMAVLYPLVFRNKKKMEHMKNVSERCEKEINHQETSCQLGNEIVQCIFKYAPELHFNKRKVE